MLHPSPPAPAKFKKVGPLATFLLCGLGLIAHFFGSLSLASAIECRRHRSLERKRRGSELRGLTDGKCGEETAEAISASRCPPRHHQPQDLRGGQGGPGGSNSCSFPEGLPSWSSHVGVSGQARLYRRLQGHARQLWWPTPRNYIPPNPTAPALRGGPHLTSSSR